MCHEKSSVISRVLEVCLDCSRYRPEEVLEIAAGVHARIRCEWGLPGEVPRHPEGIACNQCVNHCQIREGERGYCGLRKNVQGRIEGSSETDGKLSWYHDPLPTNCVGDWVCPGGSKCGYPVYSYRKQAQECLGAAQKAGLKRVRVGNPYLLW